MEERWEEFADAIKSGDTDRTNQVVDEIKDMELDERRNLFVTCFDELTGIYTDSQDGYVRQSTIRVAGRLTPGIAIVFAVADEDRTTNASQEDIEDQTDTLCGFFLEALTDDDGRVRQAAKRGFKDALRTYDALDMQDTIRALAIELDEMAANASGTQQKHLREAKEDTQFFLQSGFGRLVEGFHDEFGDSIDPES